MDVKPAARTFFREEFADQAVREVLSQCISELPDEEQSQFNTAGHASKLTNKELVRLGRFISQKQDLVQRVCRRIMGTEPDMMVLQRWNDLDLFRFRRKMLENKAIREAIDEELGRAGVAIFADYLDAVTWVHDDL
jgi:hypothetical protein